VPSESFTAAVWLTGYGVQHPEFTFSGSDFSRADPPVFARAVYQKALGFPVVGENTLVEIVHTPQDLVPIP
jgi:hypothetical protein